MEGHMPNDHGSSVYALINSILFLIGGVFTTIINTIHLKDIYNYTFGSLSIISVILIIIINTPKAWKVLIGKDKKNIE